MTYVVNPERGEVGILLGDTVYPMRPSYDAMIAIEDKVGPLLSLSYRHANPYQGLKLSELAVIVTECVRAAGKERGDPMLTGFNADKVARLIADVGVLKAISSVETLLHNMITGGSKKNQEAEQKVANSSPTEN